MMPWMDYLLEEKKVKDCVMKLIEKRQTLEQSEEP